jgi:serine/threonine protein kinase
MTEGAGVEGTPFGRYRLIELLGQGGMGEVWRAHDTRTDRVVAIKVLPAHLSDDQLFQQRFRREAHAAARLDNPHVIPIHDFGEIDGRLYVDMRLIHGRDLHTVLAGGPIQPARAVRIIEQVAKALHAAHKIGMVHRDVKPSNILVDEDDFAYLIDFGIARTADETRLTRTGLAIGTFHYLAPERLREGKDDDARADIYALACVLYECLTGEPPFAGGDMGVLIAAHLTRPPPQASTAKPDIPPLLDQVIATGMAKDRDQRYATTVELASAAHDAITNPILRPAPPPARVDMGTAPTIAQSFVTPRPPQPTPWSKPAPQPHRAEFRVGGFAKVIRGHKQYAGRVGRVVSVGSDFVDLKFKRTLGNFSFRRDDLVAVSSDDAEPPSSETDSSTRLRVGGWAKVTRGDKRYVGRVGKVVSIDSGLVDLKFKRTVGSLSFKREQLEAVDGNG